MKTWPLLAIFCWSFCFAQAQFRPIYNFAGSSANKTGLSSLNEDCQMEVLEQLSIDDLMAMAKTSRYYKNMASNVFKRKCSNKNFIITKDTGKTFIWPSLNNKIIEMNSELSEQVLKTFGHMIQNLMINSNEIGNENQLRKIFEYIGQYCSDSLIEFHIVSSSENPIEYISNSFEKVEFVSLISRTDDPVTIGNDTVKITDIFPAVKRLLISVKNLENQDCVKLVYPRLKAIELNANTLEKATLEEILIKNPQIQSLGIAPIALSMLKRVNDILPNLEELLLELGYGPEIFDYVDEIRFRHVKRLSVTAEDYPTNLVFDQLEEVQFPNFVFYDGWVEYFAKFPTIKKFNTTVRNMGNAMDATVLQSLAVQLPNLTELGFAPNNKLTKSHLIDFFQRNPKLSKIFLAISPDNFKLLSIVNELKRKMSEEFHICKDLNEKGWGSITIERKEWN